MGDKDFIKPLLERRGTVYFGKARWADVPGIRRGGGWGGGRPPGCWSEAAQSSWQGTTEGGEGWLKGREGGGGGRGGHCCTTRRACLTMLRLRYLLCINRSK